uniref:Uncharacterized protein n=1 Tax=Globodera pallida TaxID=36090 RepID=A0A183CTR4_GLOPA
SRVWELSGSRYYYI